VGVSWREPLCALEKAFCDGILKGFTIPKESFKVERNYFYEGIGMKRKTTRGLGLLFTVIAAVGIVPVGMAESSFEDFSRHVKRNRHAYAGG